VKARGKKRHSGSRSGQVHALSPARARELDQPYGSGRFTIRARTGLSSTYRPQASHWASISIGLDAYRPSHSVPLGRSRALTSRVCVGPKDNPFVVAPLDDVVRPVLQHHSPLFRHLRQSAPPTKARTYLHPLFAKPRGFDRRKNRVGNEHGVGTQHDLPAGGEMGFGEAARPTAYERDAAELSSEGEGLSRSRWLKGAGECIMHPGVVQGAVPCAHGLRSSDQLPRAQVRAGVDLDGWRAAGMPRGLGRVLEPDDPRPAVQSGPLHVAARLLPPRA
jgi:hypothetical protein